MSVREISEELSHSFKFMLSDEKNILTSAYAQRSGWFNIVQNIRIGNFWFWQLLWVQQVANIRPLNNSHHFNTFDHNYWEIICLELWQNWVETTYLTILCDEKFQKKVGPNSCFPYWEGLLLLIRLFSHDLSL